MQSGIDCKMVNYLVIWSLDNDIILKWIILIFFYKTHPNQLLCTEDLGLIKNASKFNVFKTNVLTPNDFEILNRDFVIQSTLIF